MCVINSGNLGITVQYRIWMQTGVVRWLELCLIQIANNHLHNQRVTVIWKMTVWL